MEQVVTRTITLFADYVCPFSYLTSRNLQAMAGSLHVDVVRRAFELSPPGVAHAEPPSPEVWAMVEEIARDLDVRMVQPRFVPRTRKAHEAVKFAATIGRADDLDRAIYDAYFRDRADIGRIDVLVAIGEKIGVDAAALKVALDLDVHTADVAADRHYAEQLDITGTPAIVAGADVHLGHISHQQLIDWLGE